MSPFSVRPSLATLFKTATLPYLSSLLFLHSMYLAHSIFLNFLIIKMGKHAENGRTSAMVIIYTSPDLTLKGFLKERCENHDISPPHFSPKHTLCWTSLSCLLPAFPIRLWALRGWGLLFILFAVVSSVPRTLPNIYSLWKEKIRQVLILVLPLTDMWFQGSFPPCRSLVSSSIYKVGIIVLLLRFLWGSNKSVKLHWYHVS